MKTIHHTSVFSTRFFVVLAGALLAGLFMGVANAHAQNFTPQQIERVVAMYFKDAPEMVEVARCESGMRQYTDSGATLRGGTGGMMIGLFQLHERYHRQAASAMGLNIDSLVGNLMYARHLYKQEGIRPWISCAPASVPSGVVASAATVVVPPPPAPTPATGVVEDDEDADDVSAQVTFKTPDPAPVASPTSASLTQRLTFGTSHPEVSVLRRALAAANYYQGDTEGSSRFDIPLMQALVRFQCDQGITCGEGKTLAEYGAVGERTRAKLGELL